jgi:putative transposase
MLSNHKLAQAIADCGFHEFKRQLEYKAKKFGCEIIIADRFYPSSKTCSRCGHKKENLSLSERIYCCENCGFEIDRDLNAAINLSRLAKA